MDLDAIYAIVLAILSPIALLLSNKYFIQNNILKKVDVLIKGVETQIDKNHTTNIEAHKIFSDSIVTINNCQDKIIDFFNRKDSNKYSIDKMNNIRDYYLSKINKDSFKLFASFKTNLFIDMVGKIIDEEMNVAKLDSIINLINSNHASIKVEMLDRFPSDFVNLFLFEHDARYNAYLKNVETIVSAFENHHRERFLSVSTRFIKDFLLDLNSYK